MTRILFLTDSHVGGSPDGFHHQPRQCHRIHEVFRRLSQIVAEVRPDLVVHGGDITEHGSDAEMAYALDMLASLGAPIALCLGNHDLGQDDGLGLWQRRAAQRGMACGDTMVRVAGIDVLLLNTAWTTADGPAHRWNPGDATSESILTEQLDWLSRLLQERLPVPTILVVHGPMISVPPRLTGLADPVHVPAARYRMELGRILDGHSQIRLVLSGHNHVNCIEPNAGRLLTSTAAISEMPGCVRLIETDGNTWSLRTLSLWGHRMDEALDPTRMWILGSEHDRCVDW